MVTERGRGDAWLFGYGSLVWRPAFDHDERRPATLAGWARRFWQGSTDHRGLPGAPGRVVTLVPDDEAVCWGMAYRIGAARRAEILEALDHRERGGFERRDLPVRLAEGRTIEAIVYVARPHNPNYLGPAPLPEIADQIRRSHGPSGANVEYLERLAEALREMGAADDHVFELAELMAR